jgi:hypothetical protein
MARDNLGAVEMVCKVYTKNYFKNNVLDKNAQDKILGQFSLKIIIA